MYHKVDIVAPTVWWVSVETFARQMDALAKREVVYLSDYDPASKTQCVITFDDAYENVCRHAAPVLAARRLPFEVFINGDFLGRWNHADPSEPLTRYCSLEHLEEIVRCGGRIEWHTRSHTDLTKIGADAVDHQLSVPDELQARFPRPHLRWFAYPYGVCSPRVVDAVRGRFEGAVAVLEGRDDDRFQLNRVVADETLSPSDLRAG
jgi:peptidoglycan/xylan/chitin deacetylase (PgdA/CDA1 family)